MMFLAFCVYFVFLILLAVVSVQGGQRTDRGNDTYLDKSKLESIVANEVLFRNQCPSKAPFIGSFGINISNIYSIDLASSSFSVEGTAWLKYKKEDRPQWMKEWDPVIYESPVKMVSFVNATDRTNLEYKVLPSLPVEDTDERFIQWIYYSGRFVTSDLDLRLFPFESIDLSVEVDLDDVYATEAQILFEPSGPILTTSARISGYDYMRSSVSHKIHCYRTNWGFTYSEDHFGIKDYSLYHSFIVKSSFSRNPWNSFLNIFLPLIIVMVVVLSSPLIAIQDYETRLAIPASALLVLVFLQEGYKSILPKGLNYPTLADLIYIFYMVLSIVVFVWSLVQTKVYFGIAELDDLSVSSLARLDFKFFILTSSFYVLAPFFFYFVYANRFRKRSFSR